MVDPAVQWVARGVVALSLATAAAHKWRDVARFRAAVEAYQLFPPLWAVPVAAALIAAETGVAIALWLPRVTPVAAIAAAALLMLYAAAMAVNLARGRRDIDCGCAGPARRQSISAGLVGRNALLALVALVGALPAGGRELAWADGVTIAAGTATLALLYAAADGLLANAPRSAALRVRHVGDTMPIRVEGALHG